MCMNYIFDAHCHFKGEKLADNITGLITNAAQYSDWDLIIHAMVSDSRVWGAIGIHPWYVSDTVDAWDEKLEHELALHPGLMVGEIGLDKNKPDMEKQIAFFTKQLEIANRAKRGVHIHCVGMWDTVREILQQNDFSQIPFFLFHRFSGAAGDIAILIKKHNAYFSYRGNDNSAKIHAVPVDRLLTESDSDTPQTCAQWATDMAAMRGITTDTFYNNAKRMIENG